MTLTVLNESPVQEPGSGNLGILKYIPLIYLRRAEVVSAEEAYYDLYVSCIIAGNNSINSIVQSNIIGATLFLNVHIDTNNLPMVPNKVCYFKLMEIPRPAGYKVDTLTI